VTGLRCCRVRNAIVSKNSFNVTMFDKTFNFWNDRTMLRYTLCYWSGSDVRGRARAPPIRRARKPPSDAGAGVGRGVGRPPGCLARSHARRQGREVLAATGRVTLTDERDARCEMRGVGRKPRNNVLLDPSIPEGRRARLPVVAKTECCLLFGKSSTGCKG
jgi:hypothetical protein